MLLAALATIPLTFLEGGQLDAHTAAIADWSIWAIFVVEYVAKVAFGGEALAYVKRNRIDLAVIIISFPALPTLMGLARVARLARFFRLLRVVSVTARAVDALREVFVRRGVLFAALFAVIVIVGGGGCLALLEPNTVKGGFGDGVWWAIVTASTVGYGDIAPSTLVGRIIAIILMMTGVGLVSTLAASITSYFLESDSQNTQDELKQRLDRIEAMLQQLVEQRAAAAAAGARATPPSPTLPSGL